MSRLGASSYEHGDGGGAYGDYEHGVSEAWINKRVRTAKVSKKRNASFAAKMEAKHKSRSAVAKQMAKRGTFRQSDDHYKYHVNNIRVANKYGTAMRAADRKTKRTAKKRK